MANTKNLIQSVKELPEVKSVLSEKLLEMKQLNTASKAELATRYLADTIIFEEAIQIMGNAINDAEIDIEMLEQKNEQLEKELNLSEEDKEKMNKLYYNKKVELQNDENTKNVRIMNRLKKTLIRSKAILEQ